MTDIRQNTPQPTDPLAQLSEPGDVFRNPSQTEFVRNLLRLLRQAFAQIMFRNRAVPSFILQSESGKSFMVTINDDGTLRTEYVRG